MAMQLELYNVLEQSPLEMGNVEAAEASTSAFLTTTLKNITLEVSDKAQNYSGKLSSISVQPIVKAVDETSHIEVSTSGEEIKNEVVPSVLPEQAMTVLEKTKIVVVEQGLVQEEVSDHDEEIENKNLHLDMRVAIQLKKSKSLLKLLKFQLNSLPSDLNGRLLG